MKRRLFVASSIAAALGACAPIGTKLNDSSFHELLRGAESLNYPLIGTHGLAREYREQDVDRDFRVNGLPAPQSSQYERFVRDGFASYRLRVDGAVQRRMTLSLAQLQRMPQTTQITRHDCVEGWSAIGSWTGVRLSDVLDLAQPRDDARFVVFHCMDVDDGGTQYYESLDIRQARHPQTLLSLRLNDRAIDPDHGAPVRLRVPTQLGYKSAKWVARLEIVGSFATLFGGHGGYWEDQGYEWYAGI